MTFIILITMVNQICCALDETTYNHIVKEALERDISKSKALSLIASTYFSNDSAIGTNEIILREQLKLREERIQDIEKSLAWLRDAYSFLAVRALPEPKQKRSLIDKILRRNKVAVIE